MHSFCLFPAFSNGNTQELFGKDPPFVLQVRWVPRIIPTMHELDAYKKSSLLILFEN